MSEAVLILFLAGDTIDGVLEWAGGRRVRLGDGSTVRPAETGSAWLLPGGGANGGLGSAELERWQQKFSTAREQAQQQIGAMPVAVRLVVPPDLSETARDSLVIACHLAGFACADCAGIELCLGTGTDGAQSGPMSIVQWGLAGLRAWSIPTGIDGPAGCEFIDLGSDHSAASLSAELVERLGLRGRTASEAALVLPALLAADPDEGPAQAYVADPGGPPEVIFVGRTVRHELGVRALGQLTAGLGDDWGALHLFGPLSGLLAIGPDRLDRASFAMADLSLSAPLENAPVPAGETVRLNGRISIGSEFLQRTAGAAVELSAGSPLPLVRIFESFHTGAMIDRFAIYYTPPGGQAVTIATVALPPLLEGKPFSRLRLRVLADSDRFLVVAVNLASGLVEQTVVHDKRTGGSATIQFEVRGSTAEGG